MTNEEKAQEICEKNKQFHVECSSLECYMSALDMARWKDEMLKNLLKERIDNCVLTDAYEGVQYETYVALFKDLFNEEL